MFKNLKNRYLLLFSLMLFCFSNSCSAFSVWAADMNYSWYNKDTLKLTVTVYTDCSISGTPSTQIGIRPDCASSTSVYGTLSKSIDVTPVCKRSCTPCSNSSCKFPFGITRSIITAFISLKGYNCCNFNFSWTGCCRPIGLTNTSGTQFYLESSINTCYLKNNVSPVFQQAPVLMLTRGECVDRMQNTSANTGDSIVYSLSKPLTGSAAYVSYSGYFNAQEPLTYDNFGTPGSSYSFSSCQGFHYNSKTGELQFKPTKTETTAIAYTADQWHKDSSGTYRLVGSVTRSTVLSILDSLNNPPIITDGFHGTGKHVLTLCSGKTLSLTLVASDPDKDTMNLDWSTNISSASYKSASSTYIASTFNWTPKLSDIRKEPYPVTVTVTDNHCPLPSVRQEYFLLYVIKGLPDSVKINKLDSGCGKYFVSASADTAQHYNYQWYINGKLKSSAKAFAFQTIKNGIYQIDLKLGNAAGCTTDFYDSIVCNSLPNINAGTTINLCPKTSGKLNGSGQGTLSWLGGKSISSLTDMHATISPDSSTIYVLKATNGGCSSYDTVHVNVSQLFLKMPFDQRVCGKSSIFVQKLNVYGPDDAHYTWSPDTVLVTKEDTEAVTVRITKPVKFTVTATDKYGCKASGQFNVNVNRLFVSAGAKLNMCPDDSVQLNATIIGNGVTYKWKKTSGINKLTVLNPYVRPISSQWYHLSASDTFGCSAEDSVYVNVYPKSAYNFSSNPVTICKGSQGNVSILGSGITKYDWTPATEVTWAGPATVFSPTASRTYYVTMTNIYGCSFKDSVKVNLDNDCVYPGDANHDKTVNYLDLLNIGIGYGTTGPTRPNAGTSWQAQSCMNWGKTTSVGAIDFKHLDTNGDGTIDKADKTAIVNNYGNSHSKNEVQMGSRAGNPPLYFKFSKDTFYRGQLVTASLYLGNSGNNISAVYGVALRYAYYKSCIEKGSLAMAYNCDFFCNTSSLNIVHNNIPFIESSVVNTDHLGITGFGKIADISYQLSADSTLYPMQIDTLNLSLYNALVIDKNGNAITIDPQPGQAIVVRDKTSGMAPQSQIISRLSVYPNPFNSEFSLSLSLNKSSHVIISCMDILGRETGRLLDKNLGRVESNFSFKDAEAGIGQPGIYFIKVQVGDEVTVIRLVKI